MMKIKEGLEVSTSDVWYDLNEGYLRLENILEDEIDIHYMYEAINLINEFYDSCVEQIGESFIR